MAQAWRMVHTPETTTAAMAIAAVATKTQRRIGFFETLSRRRSMSVCSDTRLLYCSLVSRPLAQADGENSADSNGNDVAVEDQHK